MHIDPHRHKTDTHFNREMADQASSTAIILVALGCLGLFITYLHHFQSTYSLPNGWLRIGENLTTKEIVVVTLSTFLLLEGVLIKILLKAKSPKKYILN